MNQVGPCESTKLLDQLRRAKSIKSSLEGHLHKCDPQLGSPLWRVLPLELRTMIFEYACAPYEDLSRAFDEAENHCRPGHRGPLISSTGLLRTCRRAWLEAHALPLRQASRLVWWDQDRQWHGAWEYMLGQWMRLAAQLTPVNRGHIHEVQVILRYFRLPPDGYATGRLRHVLRALRPKRVRIIVPNSHLLHTHPWRGHGERIDLVGIRNAIEACDGIVDVFQLELEANKLYKADLDMIVAQARQLKGRTKRARDSEAAKADYRLAVLKEPRTWHWTRPGTPKPIEYQVTELEWENVPQSSIRYGLPRPTKAPNLVRDLRRRMPGAVSKWRDLPLPLYQDRVHQHSVEIAHAGELQRRKLFAEQMNSCSDAVARAEQARQRRLLAQRIVADDEEKAQREWEANGSLMCFV